MAAQGRQWFSLRDSSSEAMANGVSETVPILEEFMLGELDRTGVSADRLVLVGFSQGTMMSLQMAFSFESSIAGIVGYSGRMILGPTGSSALNSKPPTMLIHGDGDELVPVESMLETAQQLLSHGISAQWHICQGLGHSIDQQGLDIGARFLRDCFAGMT